MNTVKLREVGMFTITVSLACKLGSILVHVDEFLGPKGHQFDRVALETLMQDPEVEAWLTEMDDAALIPKRR
jgi:hypothetical protein